MKASAGSNQAKCWQCHEIPCFWSIMTQRCNAIENVNHCEHAYRHRDIMSAKRHQKRMKGGMCLCVCRRARMVNQLCCFFPSWFPIPMMDCHLVPSLCSLSFSLSLSLSLSLFLSLSPCLSLSLITPFNAVNVLTQFTASTTTIYNKYYKHQYKHYLAYKLIGKKLEPMSFQLSQINISLKCMIACCLGNSF